MYIDPRTIDDIKRQVDITQLIGKYIPLIASGVEFKGRCPFHNDDTPSLTVYPQTNTFHCFGCKAGSSVIDFYKEIEQVSFPQACRDLALEFGIPISESKEYQSNISMYRLNETLCTKYQEDLLNHPHALDYLRERNISMDSVTKWRLGYAQIGCDSYKSIGKRLVFPVTNDQGHVISFSGRYLNDYDKPKYWNGPNNEIFTKGSLLYGMDKVRQHVKETNSLIIVEGFMDVISMHQAGIQNVVATMGTALTETHAKYIKQRYPNTKIYLAFDGDQAGRKCTIEANRILRNVGIIPLGYSTPYDCDMHDLTQMYGQELYPMILDAAREVYGLWIESLSSRYFAKINDARREFISEIQPIYEEMNEYKEDLQICAEKKWYLSMISDALKINPEDLNHHLTNMKK